MSSSQKSNVRLIAVTRPVSTEFDSHQDANDLISYCARVSNPSNQDNFSTANKLLAYCVKHKHWSIFEMADLVMEITTTRDIGRQILRHRSFAFQEFSQRYASPEIDVEFEREFRLQDLRNRQNSYVPEINVTNVQIGVMWASFQNRILNLVKEAYEYAMINDIAKEQARAILPEGLTMSRMYMKGNVRDWYHYCQLRMGPETQKEHREIANRCWTILVQQFPFLKEIEDED
jgi:thymidylate synthase (FAD)